MSTFDDTLYTVIDWNKKGDHAKYHELVENLRATAQYNAAEFFEQVHQLTPCTCLLDPSCRDLVNVILEAEWVQKSDCFVSKYVAFLSALVSAHTSWAEHTGSKKRSQQQEEDEYVHNAIKAVLDVVPNGPDVLLPVLESEFPAEHDSIHAQISYVSGILRVLDYAPVLHSKVIGIVVDRIMRMDSVCPLTTEDFDLLDSQMAYDAIFGDDTMPNNTHVQTHVNNLGPADPSNDTGLGAVSYPDPEVVVNTLDGMLCQVFMYLDRFVNTFNEHLSPSSPTSSPTSSPIPSSTSSSSSFSTPSTPSTPPFSFSLADEPSKPIQDLYTVLLLNFTESILRTSTSRHAQYLVFYLTSLSPIFIDYFLGTLIHRIVHAYDPQAQGAQAPSTVAAAAIERGVAAAAYLPSFLIRARYIDQEHIRMIVELLSDYALDVVKKVESTTAALANALAVSSRRLILRSRTRLNARLTALLDTDRNTVFYAVVQALLQIFCDHWRILQVRQDEGGVGRWHLGVEDIPRIVESQLKPLQLCTEEVVKQFSELSRALDLMDVIHSIVGVVSVVASRAPVARVNADEQVKSEPGENQEQVQEKTSRLLFEPYRLTLSAPFVKDLYVEKKKGKKEEEEEEEEDIEVKKEEKEQEVHEEKT
ncbi:hypothetical protein BG011_000304 [Mortierella polycephala]|uniref:Uncharacterized protein n=1 Tax=Mortierella polycephala TaxID=41804 RepID=A0A9P6TVW7_9FUNG|nr:hypothetical protein BG011_000304 [Mortierella polycephala]